MSVGRSRVQPLPEAKLPNILGEHTMEALIMWANHPKGGERQYADQICNPCARVICLVFVFGNNNHSFTLFNMRRLGQVYETHVFNVQCALCTWTQLVIGEPSTALSSAGPITMSPCIRWGSGSHPSDIDVDHLWALRIVKENQSKHSSRNPDRKPSLFELGYIIFKQWMPRAVGSYLATSDLDEIPQLIDFSKVRRRIDTCRETHFECKERSAVIAKREAFRPVTVIDCHNRHLVALDKDSEYVALSYVWGQADLEPEKLTLEDGSFCTLDTLPAGIEDSLTATTKLGYRYLWVDRYCIDQSNAEEKVAQISQMDLIYGNAACCIVNASGLNPSTSLPGVSQERLIPPELVLPGIAFAHTPTHPLRHVHEASMWAQRGWTYQEAALAARLVVICPDMVYLECAHRGVDTEKLVFDGPPENTTVPVLNPSDFTQSPEHMVWRHIQAYNTRNFTHGVDACLAFKGIFSAMASSVSNYPSIDDIVFSHFWGLPLLFRLEDNYHGRENVRGMRLTEPNADEALAESLGWEALYDGVTHLRRSGVPSWSWASRRARIRNFCISKDQGHDRHDSFLADGMELEISEQKTGRAWTWRQYCQEAVARDAQRTVRATDAFADLAPVIRIRGPIFPVCFVENSTFDFDKTPTRDYPHGWCNSDSVRFDDPGSPVAKTQSNSALILLLSAQDDRAFHGPSALFSRVPEILAIPLTICRFSRAAASKKFFIKLMLIKPVPDARQDSFQRIGLAIVALRMQPIDSGLPSLVEAFHGLCASDVKYSKLERLSQDGVVLV